MMFTQKKQKKKVLKFIIKIFFTIVDFVRMNTLMKMVTKFVL